MSPAAFRPGGKRPVFLRSRGETGTRVPGVGVLGLSLFIASLTMVFGAAVVAYFVVRSRASEWPPPGTAELPAGLWLSTAFLLGVSLAIQSALGAIRRGAGPAFRRWLVAAFGLATAFLLSQAWNWQQFQLTDTRFDSHLFGFTFYMLTGLHAAHVIGGWIALLFVVLRSRWDFYSRAGHQGVRLCAIYWHYLDVVWLILFALLIVPR